MIIIMFNYVVISLGWWEIFSDAKPVAEEEGSLVKDDLGTSWKEFVAVVVTVVAAASVDVFATDADIVGSAVAIVVVVSFVWLSLAAMFFDGAAAPIYSKLLGIEESPSVLHMQDV